MGVRFNKLTIHDWRQFANLDIEFHERLTVITGGNGAGKSTVLRLLGQHFGWDATLLATPRIGNSGDLTYSSGVWDLPVQAPGQQGTVIGELSYTNGQKSNLRVPSAAAVQYSVQIERPQNVAGINIGSHRPISGYRQVGNIPTTSLGAQHAYQVYFNETVNLYQNSYSVLGPMYRMKEAIISMAMFGPGNEYVQRNERVLRVLEGFKQVLRNALPKDIGFKDISVRLPDVVLVTDSGEFIIDASSGGIMSIIDLAWQIYLYSQGQSEFVALLDEPENHLHPAMQRSILSSLIESFPNAQFVVATHSPFIVSSVKDSHLYVLRHSTQPGAPSSGVKRAVHSLRLDKANKAGTAGEILRDVLGVPVTLPKWAEDEVKEIAAGFEVNSLTSETLSDLRRRLDDAGLGEFYPDALRQVVDNHD